MAFLRELRAMLEHEENATVGDAFGGDRKPDHKNYSIAKIRDWMLSQAPSSATGQEVESSLWHLSQHCPADLISGVIGSIIRFSFLIELTNLKVGSTKMKTRWMPGLILMPQEGSFEPIRGRFEPGNDSRSASFEACAATMARACTLLVDAAQRDPSIWNLVRDLNQTRRVPYEFPLTYATPAAEPVHRSTNVVLADLTDLRWLIRARFLLCNCEGGYKAAIRQIEKTKLEVKVYKTDRALTGKDKTNRAKRWEVLAGDFQHATLEECWSVEKKLIYDLVCFDGFPARLRHRFEEAELVSPESPVTRCPVTFEPLSFTVLADAILNPQHGTSQYQIGHLSPLKRGGKHVGANVCWQSAHGNRIQGDLSIEETHAMLDTIQQRRRAHQGD